MSDELQELVNRFLAWKLPTDFYPDCHIHFDREKAEKWGPQLWPSGTNLLNADQARAMLEHVTEPLRTQFADTERDNANLRTVMIAAAEEIATHWTAHCNAEGYGPINLLRRLQEGIAAQYGYTGGGWARINSELATLRTQLAAQPRQPLSVDDVRSQFEAWVRTRPGHPFAGKFLNLMWDAWKAARAITGDKP